MKLEKQKKNSSNRQQTLAIFSPVISTTFRKLLVSWTNMLTPSDTLNTQITERHIKPATPKSFCCGVLLKWLWTSKIAVDRTLHAWRPPSNRFHNFDLANLTVYQRYWKYFEYKYANNDASFLGFVRHHLYETGCLYINLGRPRTEVELSKYNRLAFKVVRKQADNSNFWPRNNNAFNEQLKRTYHANVKTQKNTICFHCRRTESPWLPITSTECRLVVFDVNLSIKSSYFEYRLVNIYSH